MKCPKCHKINKAERKYCNYCGEQFFIFCIKCGFTNDRGDIYCGGCGINLNDMFDFNNRPAFSALTPVTTVSEPQEKTDDIIKPESTVVANPYKDGISKQDMLELLESTQQQTENDEEKDKKKSVAQTDIDNLFKDE